MDMTKIIINEKKKGEREHKVKTHNRLNRLKTRFLFVVVVVVVVVLLLLFLLGLFFFLIQLL